MTEEEFIMRLERQRAIVVEARKREQAAFKMRESAYTAMRQLREEYCEGKHDMRLTYTDNYSKIRTCQKCGLER